MNVVLVLPARGLVSDSAKIFAPGQLFKQVVSGLRELGHEVSVFPTLEDENFYTDKVYYSVEEKKYGNNVYSELSGNFDYELMVTRNALKKAEDISADVVHFFSYFAGHYFQEFVNIPCLFTVHDVLFDIDTYESRKYDLFPQHNYSFVSFKQQQTYKERYNITNSSVVHNGVDVGEYFEQSRQDRKYILYMGRMLEEKGFHLALALSERVGVPLVFCTSDADKNTIYFKALLPKIKAVGARDLGFVSGDLRAKIYRNALFTIFPSTWNDSFGMVITESMAQGTPVIGFDTGAVGEIIEHGRSGYVVPITGSIDGKLAALELACRDLLMLSDQAYLQMSLSAYRRVKNHFSTLNMVKGYESIYKKIAEQAV